MKSGFRVQGIGCRAKRVLPSLGLLFFAFTLNTAYAGDVVSSAVLIEDAKTFDKKEITYRGEAVTAIIKRGAFSWVNLNDGANAIGVWAKASELNVIKHLGSYNRKGDIVEVEGIFNRACKMHNGELDIHAHSVKVIKPGYIILERVDTGKLKATVALFLLVILITVIFRRRI